MDNDKSNWSKKQLALLTAATGGLVGGIGGATLGAGSKGILRGASIGGGLGALTGGLGGYTAGAIKKRLEKKASGPTGVIVGGLAGGIIGAAGSKKENRARNATNLGLLGSSVIPAAKAWARARNNIDVRKANAILRNMQASGMQVTPEQATELASRIQDKAMSGGAGRTVSTLMGSAAGAGLGALGHKLVGGKKENRAKAGKVGALLGGAAGLVGHNYMKPLTKAIMFKNASILEDTMDISQLVLDMEKIAALSPDAAGALLGAGASGLAGGVLGAGLGASTGKKGDRSKRALIGAGLGAAALGAGSYAPMKETIQMARSGHNPKGIMAKMVSHPVNYAGNALLGGAAGGLLGMGGHKLVGGKAENRAKAGKIGAGIGAGLGLLGTGVRHLYIRSKTAALSPSTVAGLGGALAGGLSGSLAGAGLGASTAKKGERGRRALIGAGLGGAASAALTGHAVTKAMNRVQDGASHLDIAKGIVSHPANYVGGALGGGAMGGLLGMGGHKLFGGKKENRAKAGKIGAGIGAGLGLLSAGAHHMMTRKLASVTEIMAEIEKQASMGAAAGAIGGGLSGALGGSLAGATTSKKDARGKGALIGAGLGAATGAATMGHLGHKLEKAHGIDALQHGMPMEGIRSTLKHPANYVTKGILGAGVGGLIGAGGHKLFGGKAENRAKAGKIGAGIGAGLGLLSAGAQHMMARKLASVTEIMAEIEKQASMGAAGLTAGALAGGISGGIGGALTGASTAKKGERGKRALQIGGAGALLGGIGGMHAMHKHAPKLEQAFNAVSENAHPGRLPDYSEAVKEMGHLQGHPVNYLTSGLGGAALGGLLGMGGHKLVGGKAENRAKAGKIGAGIGGIAGLALNAAKHYKMTR